MRKNESTKPRLSRTKGARVGQALVSFTNLMVMILVVVSVSVFGIERTFFSHAATFGVQSYLQEFTPGQPHESLPHGVPSSYDWHSNSKLYGLTPPTNDSGYVNFWGQVYVDTTDIRPSNTRVEIAGCQLWVLMNGASVWTLAAGGSGSLQGGQWSEDFSRVVNGSLTFKAEPDGGQSVVTAEGANAHFWPDKPLYNVGSNMKAQMVVCSSRLVLNDQAGADDRRNSHYIMSVGSDWRKSDYSCPEVGSITVCDPVQQGKFIRVANHWQLAVASTMSSSQLASYPLPPASAFVLPDGTYPDGSTAGAGGSSVDSGGTSTAVGFAACPGATSITNLALNRSVAVSSVQSGTNYDACKAVDGSNGFGASAADDSRWQSEPSDPQWYTVDLGSKQGIGSIAVNWEYASAKAYQIQVSNDNSNWTTVASETNNGVGSTSSAPTSGLKLYNLSGVSGRYVRVYGTERNNLAWGYSIVELSVSPPSPGTPTPTPTHLVGDLDGNGHVDGHDVALLLINWNKHVTPNTGGDLDGNGLVSGHDVALLLTNWGK